MLFGETFSIGDHIVMSSEQLSKHEALESPFRSNRLFRNVNSIFQVDSKWIAICRGDWREERFENALIKYPFKDADVARAMVVEGDFCCFVCSGRDWIALGSSNHAEHTEVPLDGTTMHSLPAKAYLLNKDGSDLAINIYPDPRIMRLALGHELPTNVRNEIVKVDATKQLNRFFPKK